MKYLKLLFIAALLVGGVVLLIKIASGGLNTSDVKVTSSEGQELVKEIDSLCLINNNKWEGVLDKWTQEKYKRLENKINISAKNELIEPSEKKVICGYLYSSSCRLMFDCADQLFQQASYPEKQVRKIKSGIDFLKEQKAGDDSNLTQCLNMFAEYDKIMRASVSSTASYTSPLKPFNRRGAEAIAASIRNMKYYKSHFSKNPSVRAKVDNLGSNLDQIETDYYMNLERCIEEHYKAQLRAGVDVYTAKERLFSDQVEFEKLADNATAYTGGATRRLEKFVNGGH